MQTVRNQWAPVGAFVAIVGLGLLHARVLATNPYPYEGSRVWWGLALAAAFTVGGYALGVPDVPRARRQAAAAAVGAAIGGVLAVASAQALLGSQVLPRFVLLGGAGVVGVWFFVVSEMSMRQRRRTSAADRILLVADGETVARLRAELADLPYPLELAGHLTPNDALPRADVPAPLLDFADGKAATVIVLDRAAQDDQGIVDQVAMLHERGVRVRTLSLFYEQWLLRLPITELERVSLMFDIGEVHRARFARRKRLLDIAIACAGLPVLALAIPLVALGNLVGNRGSLLFRQDRVGKNGEVFRITKFRSMVGTDGPGTWTTESDPRITPFGRFLRRSHVDELPQLVDVLRGSLSIVGPRPEQPHYVDELTSKLPFYELRHLVQPGLTGWAQIQHGYAASTTDALEKLQYEFWYLRRQSMWLDLRIMARTVRSVLGQDGR
ncbi:MAG: sugar transferase [Actinomycetota bacterium]